MVVKLYIFIRIYFRYQSNAIQFATTRKISIAYLYLIHIYNYSNTVLLKQLQKNNNMLIYNYIAIQMNSQLGVAP